MFFSRKSKKELKRLKYENAKLAETVYQINGKLLYGSELISSWNQTNQGKIYKPPTSFIEIYLTCQPVGSVIDKITDWISKFDWSPDLPGNDRESMTMVMRQTINSLLYDGNAYWDISNGLFYCLRPDIISVKWDKTRKSSTPDYANIYGKKVYYIIDDKGNEHELPENTIVHFILTPIAGCLKGASKLLRINNEINQYYHRHNAANKKYDYNKLPEAIIAAPDADPGSLSSLKEKVSNTQNSNDIPHVNFAAQVLPLRRDDNLTGENISFLQDFRSSVYFAYGLTETDLGIISSTKASADAHQEQTQNVTIESVMDSIEEEFNRNPILRNTWGEFSWEKPDVSAEINNQDRGDTSGTNTKQDGDYDAENATIQ